MNKLETLKEVKKYRENGAPSRLVDLKYEDYFTRMMDEDLVVAMKLLNDDG